LCAFGQCERILNCSANFFYTIYQTDNDKKKRKKHSRTFVEASAIRTIVSEFACHPVYIILLQKLYKSGI
jgi:hypothetical protein